MFKSWRSDKKKIKVVFQLQFQATRVPKLKRSGVTIALVPEDVGKSTLRLEKVAVQDGICLWENPVYETVKLIRETKTGTLSEKIYHFVVSNGSSKSGFLGEASIDFADFVAESEPVTISLPLKFANSGAILHVTIHKIEGGEDHSIRYVGDGEEVAISRDDSLQSQGINYSDNVQNSTEEEQLDDELFSSIRQNSMPQRVADTGMAKKNMHRRTSTDWSGTSASDESLVELSNSPEDIPREWHRRSENPVEKLRSENVMLSRQVEVSELELQSLRKQILKENNRTRDLSRQIIRLQEERDAMKMEAENEGSKVLLKEIRQELDHEKDLNTNLRSQLQKMEDSNSNLILAVKDLNEMLEQKNREISHLSRELEASTSIEEVRSSEHDADEVHLMKQTITDLNSELEFYKKHKEELEMHIEELILENDEISSQQQESIKTQNESSEYLAATNELESQVQRLEDKIASAKKETEKAQKQLISTRSLKDKKEMVITNLQSEMENIRVECSDLKHSLVREEREKEKLRKQLSQLRNDLKKKEEEITTSSSHSISAPQESKDITSFRENVSKSRDKLHSKMTATAVPCESDAKLAELVSEVEGLKDRNKCMECELKDMEERYSEISLKFAEVEGERQQLVMTVRNLKNGKKN